MARVVLDGGQSEIELGGQTLTYIRQQVAIQCPGAPDTLIDAQLQLVAKEFYTKSTGWRQLIGPYSVTENRDIIQLNPVDANSRVQFVLGAYLLLTQTGGPTPLVPLVRPPSQSSNGSNPPTSYFMQKPDVMQLYPFPSASRGKVLYIYACMAPTAAATVLPDIAYSHHVDGLIWGVLTRMMNMPKKNWTNKELAATYDRKYRQEIMIARDFANRGYGPSDTGMTFPNFAGRSGSQILPRATS